MKNNILWKKLGLIYNPYDEKNRHEKLITHSSNPVALKLEGSIYRIFYSGRDSQNRSSVGGFDYDIRKLKIVQDYKKPFLIHGSQNSFFADGISIGCYYENKNSKYILFMGWQNPKKSHWRGDIGRIKVDQNFKLEIDSNLPLLATDNNFDKISLSYPWVSIHNKVFHMFYGSTLNWKEKNNEMVHVINRAESFDGNKWIRKGLEIPYKINEYQAFSRPSHSFLEDNSERIWFSYRSGQGEKYRIGYAEKNHEKWNVNNKMAGINISASGWDSEMIEYPFVFNHEGINYMLYNGNGFGKTGIGLAIET